MTDDASALERECQVFVRFLTRRAATPYVVGKYISAHEHNRAFVPDDDVNRALLAVARRSPLTTRVADAYARLRVPRGALRKKLVLLLAILETTAPFAHNIDHAPPRSLAMAVLDLLVAGVIGASAAVAGLIVFGPWHLVVARRHPRV